MYVNRTKMDQGVYGPGQILRMLKPGQAVTGDHYAAYAGRGKALTEEPDDPRAIIDHAGDQTVAYVAARLASDADLDKAVQNKRAELEAAAVGKTPDVPPASPPARPTPKK